MNDNLILKTRKKIEILYKDSIFNEYGKKGKVILVLQSNK